MKISNKELFNNLVKEVLSNKLKLTEDYVEKYDITDKYFWERNKKDNPINNNCGRNIVKMYESIIDYNENCNRISDEKSSEKEKYSIDKQRYEKLVEGIEKYFCVSKADDSQIIEIVKIILSKIEDENEIDYVDLLWDIKKSLKNKIEFNKKGKILLDEVEAKYNAKLAKTKEIKLPSYLLQRKIELDQMHEKLTDQHWVAIEGEPGCGKYTLALQYANCNKNDFEYIHWICWKNNLIDTIAQIPTTDDKYYTNQECESDKQFETDQERNERKKKILLSSEVPVLLIIYDVWDIIPETEITEICDNKFCDIKIIITTCHNYGNSIALPQLKIEECRDIASSLYGDDYVKVYLEDINKIYESCENNLQRYIIFLKHKKIYYDNSGVGVENEDFRYYDLPFEVSYHEIPYKATLIEHLRKTYLLHILTDSAYNKLYKILFLLIPGMNASCLIDMFDYERDLLVDLENYKLIKYENDCITFNATLQMVTLLDYSRLNNGICLDDIYKYCYSKDIVSVSNSIRMILNFLYNQMYHLKINKEILENNYFMYLNLMSMFVKRFILPFKLASANEDYEYIKDRKECVPPELIYLESCKVFLREMQRKFECYFKDIPYEAIESMDATSESKEALISLKNKIDYTLDLYNTLFGLSHTKKDKEELYNLQCNDSGIEPLILKAYMTYYYADEVEFEKILDDVIKLEQLEKYRCFFFSVIPILLAIKENNVLLKLVYEKFKPYKKQMIEHPCYCYEPFTLLEIILGNEFNVEKLINPRYNDLLTVALVLILLDRVPSNNKFALQILEKYCKDEFGIYSDIIFKMDFWINITQNLKWFYTMRKFIEDDGTANGKYIKESYDKIIDCMYKVKEKNLNSTRDCYIPRKKTDYGCSNLLDSDESV